MEDLMITKKLKRSRLTVIAEGRIDNNTSPKLDKEIRDDIDDIDEVVIDFSKVDYISSAGLRVLLGIHKTMDENGGELIIKKPTGAVTEIFNVTGFADILSIEH